MRYETPKEIAEVLARHVPRTSSSILDPCVGNGALLKPVLSRLSWNVDKVTCLDIDSSVLSTVRTSISHMLRGKLETRTGNFINWASKTSKRFDCIVMNPPFHGKRSYWTVTNADQQRKIPIEGEFVRQAISLLNNNGVLLAVLPSSVISGSTLAWLRNDMLSCGAINYLHELPERCFPGIEGRMYLIVYKKNKRKDSIVFRNHDLYTPETLVLPIDSIGEEYRFDFGYHAAQKKSKEVELAHPLFNWTPVEKVFDIFHGTERTPERMRFALHTSDYCDGFWRSRQNLTRSSNSSFTHLVSKKDILLRRLGRNCSQSFGIISGCHSVHSTHNVWVLRPHESNNTLYLLFILRCLSCFSWLPALLEKGVGAKYITGHDLLRLRIPLAMPKHFRKEFQDYSYAVDKLDFDKMRQIEKFVNTHISQSFVSD